MICRDSSSHEERGREVDHSRNKKCSTSGARFSNPLIERGNMRVSKRQVARAEEVYGGFSCKRETARILRKSRNFSDLFRVLQFTLSFKNGDVFSHQTPQSLFLLS